MKKRVISIVLVFALIICMLSSVTIANAASYPILIPKEYDIHCNQGDNVAIVYSLFREYNNEKIIVDVYDEFGNRVANVEKNFGSSTTTVVEYTVNWDTSNYAVGKYKVVARTQYYTFFEWRECPNPDISYVTIHAPGTFVEEGWQISGNRWWYQYSDGTYPTNGWASIDGLWYYFDANGYMCTGWVNDGGLWYFMDSSGVMSTGWLNDGGVWYFLDDNGAMRTGWVNDNGTWYYFNSSGSMYIGWLNDDGTWYYLDGTGAMAKGWRVVDGLWYYFYNNGSMATGWLLDGSTWYWLESWGAWLGYTEAA